MQGRLVSKATSGVGGSSRNRKAEMMRMMRMMRMMMHRLMVTKASNRAAVHGAKLPVTDTIDREQVEKEISQGKEMKQNKIKEVEKTVSSQINQSHMDDHKLTPPPVNEK